jgi:hypothetical protein
MHYLGKLLKFSVLQDVEESESRKGDNVKQQRSTYINP